MTDRARGKSCERKVLLLSLIAAVACVLAACHASPSANQEQAASLSEASKQPLTQQRAAEHNDHEGLHQLVAQGLKQTVPDLDLWTPEDAAEDLGKRIANLSSTQTKLVTNAVDGLMAVLKCCTLACSNNEVMVLDKTYEVTAGAPFNEVCLNAAGLLRGVAKSDPTIIAPHADSLKAFSQMAERNVTRRPSDRRFKWRIAALARVSS